MCPEDQRTADTLQDPVEDERHAHPVSSNSRILSTAVRGGFALFLRKPSVSQGPTHGKSR
jgi:hypothetical protein